MHLVLSALDSKDELKQELVQAFPGDSRELAPGMFACEPENESGFPLPPLAFARQILPSAREVTAPSVRAWANVVVDAIAGVLPDHEPWSLHIYPFRRVVDASRMGARSFHSQARAGKPTAPREASRDAPRADDEVGAKRCELVRDAVVELLRKRRRHLLPGLRQYEGAFFENEALVQLVLSAPDRGYVSVVPAPHPYQERRALSFFPGGEVPLAIDKQAPSRAFTKLVEAEARMARRIAARETCVDLGASPGSWTYVAVRRGARVTAVDRSDLREDLMREPRVQFERGDAFRFEPKQTFDWLLCDVIAEPERSAELLLTWLRRQWCRHFVVTLKMHDSDSRALLPRLQRELLNYSNEFWLLRLSANKKEVCAFGSVTTP